MQRDPRFFTELGGYTHDNHLGDQFTCGIPLSSPVLDGTLAGMNQEFAGPLNGFEFQPSENCPKNFIIFDHADNGSRVMFHPALAHKFTCPTFDFHDTGTRDVGRSTIKSNENEDNFSSSHKEDTEDIDALLSSEEDEEDDVVSTARTQGNYRSNSLEPYCLKEGFSSCKTKLASQGSLSSSASSSDRKERTRKMVRALRGIIPGGEDMDTPAILDEAVKYLKSLKVEVKKLGLQNFEN